ncbi:MAG: UDP-N-acetylmuramate dehydrogenase [Oscillospiraceae bacterium]|nr:UDP-N-acetylmuramate dehydrogenase [Oscillospiraceae bacterium]
MLNDCLRRLSHNVKNADIRLYEPLSNWTTFKVGGPADALFFPVTEQDVVSAINAARETATPLTVIGNGSNLLVRDGGIRGLTMCMTPMPKKNSELSSAHVSDDLLVVGASALLSKVASQAKRASLSGMEALSGIPGSVGGAAMMNAGAYDHSMSDVVIGVKTYAKDGSMRVYEDIGIKYGYRTSAMMHDNVVIVQVLLKLKRSGKEAIAAAMDEYTKKRKEKQPLKLPSAGSFFKRPQGNFAGALIEQAGLKGFYIGGAQVSTLHAGFIVNTGGATASDIINLKNHIVEQVEKKFGVVLEPEVKIIGSDTRG